MVSARMKPCSKSVWITPAACGARLPLVTVQARVSFGPVVKKGATAPQAAGVIHTDFERGFIRAETIGYDDFIQYKGEAGAAAAGRLRKEGKEYIVKEGDVLHFLFNV